MHDPELSAATVASPRAASMRPGALARLLLELTKFRLVSLVLVTTGIGFLLAGGSFAAWRTLLVLIVGTALTASGSMALNELLEMDRDARMERTRNRPLPAGDIAPLPALAFGLTAIVTGVVALRIGVNGLTAMLSLVVVALYVLVYTPLKSRNSLCTLVGAVCGAIPPMMGWTAATGSLGFGAWLLATVLFLWQIPHFLALAWLYRKDYARGGFQVLSVSDASGRRTAVLSTLYLVALAPMGVIAAFGRLTGWVAAAVTLALGLGLLTLGVRLLLDRTDSNARALFLATLVYLPITLAALVLDRQPVTGPGTAITASVIHEHAPEAPAPPD